MRVLVACEYSGRVREVEIDARKIQGFPGYLVTRDGEILTCRKNFGERTYYRKMRPAPDAKGYLGLTICGPEKSRRKVRVHRLVAEVFLENTKDNPCVRHLDGKKQNNCVENLAWGTYCENESDKRQHGTWESRRNGKLTKDDRRKIRNLSKEGCKNSELAARFNVSYHTILRLLNGATWS